MNLQILKSFRSSPTRRAKEDCLHLHPIIYNLRMNQIVIKPLPSDQWQKYRDIRLEALKTDPTAFGRTYDETAKYPEKRWRKQLEQKTSEDNVSMFFAFDGEKIIGMIGLYWRNKPAIKHIAEIHGVFVSPYYRGRGIGKRLMEAVMAVIENNPQFVKIKLGVNTTNSDAIRLYESLGFKIVGKLEKEIKLGDVYFDDYVMEKQIF